MRGRPRKDKNAPVQYLKNKDFLKEIIESKRQNKLTLKATEMIILLARRAITKMVYYNQMDREDCLQTAIFDMLKAWKTFDANKSDNAFAYFTEVAKRGFARQWNIMHRHKGDVDNSTTTISYNGTDEDGHYMNNWIV